MASVCILEHGCSGSFVESQSMPALLEKAGFTLVEEPENAEIVIANVCPSMDDPIEVIKNILGKGPKLIVTGCLSKELILSIRKLTQDASLISIGNISRIVEVAEESLQGNILEAVVQDNYIKTLPMIKSNGIKALIPIGSGCEDRCSYCSSTNVSMRSYPSEYIINEVSKAVTDGCREIWLTSHDNGSYGLADGSNLLSLVKLVLENVAGTYRLKMGLLTPKSALAMMEDLVTLFHDERVFRTLRVPADSGSNEVLGKMKRHYTVHDYRQLVDKLKRHFPEFCLVTDMVVGFPTETELQFQDSLNLMQESKFDLVNISRHYSKGRMQGQIASNVKKERAREMTELAERLALEVNRKWIGWQGSVVLVAKGKDNTLIGRNYAFKDVIVPANGHKLGEDVNVKVLFATPYDLRGKPVETGNLEKG